MPIQESRLRLVAEFVDKASGGMRRMGNELVDLAKKGQAVNKFAKVAGPALLGVSAAGGAFLFSATKLAARVETLGVVTQQLGKVAGYSRTEIEGFESAIKEQGITLQATRSSMSMMMQAQIDLAHGARLARIAQDAAVIANIDSSEAFSTLTRAILTGRVALARTMGLQVQFGNAQKRMADDIGKTVEELTEQEIIQARTNEVFKQAATIQGAYASAMTTAGKKMLSLNRHIEESRRILGEAFTPMLADAVDAVTNLLKSFEALGAPQQRAIAASIGVGVAFAGVAGAALTIVAILPSVTAGLGILGIAAGTALLPISLIALAIGAVTMAAVAHHAKMQQMEEDIAGVEVAAARAGTSYADYKKEIAEYSEKTGLAVKKTVKLEKATSSMYGTVTKTSGVFGHYGQQVEETTEEIEIQIGAIEEMTEAEFNLFKAKQRTIDATKAWTIEQYAAYHGITLMTEAEESALTATQRLQAEFDAARDGLSGLGDEATETEDEIKSMFDTIDTGIGSTIEGMMKQIEFAELGGEAIQQQVEAVKEALLAQKITPEEAKELLGELSMAAIDIQLEMGEITPSEAAAQIRENLGVPLTEAWDIVKDMRADLSAFNFIASVEAKLEGYESIDARLDALNAKALIVLSRVEQIETGLEEGGYQHGGQFRVQGPPGRGDTTMVAFPAKPGETVTIKQSGEPAPSSAGRRGPMIGVQNNYVRDDLDIQRLSTLFRRE